MANGTTATVADSTPIASARRKPRAWELALVGAVLFAAVGHLLLKYGLTLASAAPTPSLWRYAQPAILAGLCIYGLGTALWVFAVSRAKISYLYPMTAVNYAIVALGGKLLLGELISMGRWLGIATVVFGVVLMQWSARSESK